MSIQVAKLKEFRGHTQAIYTMAASSKPGYFYSAGADGMVVLWRVNEDDGLLVARSEHPVYSICRTDNYLLFGSNNGLLTVLKSDNHEFVKQFKLGELPIFDIVKHAEKIYLAMGNGQIIVLDNHFSVVKTMALSQRSIRKIFIHKNEKWVGASDGFLRLLNENDELVKEIKAYEQSVFAIGGRNGTILSGGRDAVVKVWENNEFVKIINAHWYHVNDIQYNSTQTLFATASLDKSIKIWDAENFELLKVIERPKLQAHQSSVNKILWIERNRFISCSDDRTLMCFEIIE